MKHTLKIFLVMAVAVVCLGSIDEGTPRLTLTAIADTCMVGGPISSNTTWSTAYCDTYVIYGNLLVEEGATLTIMPGVVVAFQQDYRLEVRGALTARGEASDSIVFTGWESNQNPSWWDRIKFRNSSIDTTCSLLYCRIEYAMYGVYCDTASPTISHSLIRKCENGIYCFRGSPHISQNTIRENQASPFGSGVFIDGGAPVTFGNIIERNTYYGVKVLPSSGCSTSLSMTADTVKQNTYGGIELNYGSISATIRSCEIYGNPKRSGIWARQSGSTTYLRVTNCYIHDDTTTFGGGGGIHVDASGGFNGGFVVIDSNCISGNWSTESGNIAGGIHFVGVDSARVQYNDIVGNSGPGKYVYEVYSGEPSSPDIHGEYNWWGTTDSAEIANLIYDYYDNVDLRKFIFVPFDTLPHCEIWIRGDANGDGQVNLADAVYLVNYLFIGGPPPDPMDAGDANCSGDVDLADAVYIVNWLFIGGPPPGCP
jgi:hypothetical protein